MLPNVIHELQWTIKYIEKYATTVKSKIQIQELKHDCQEAKIAIENYQHHLKRNFIQELDMEELFKKANEKVVVVTIDFGMKLLPR